MSLAAGIARSLGVERRGNGWRCECPLGCGYGLTLADGGDGRLLAYCFGGCAYADLRPVLFEHELFGDDDFNLASVPPDRVRST
jgi:hypothetical protein